MEYGQMDLWNIGHVEQKRKKLNFDFGKMVIFQLTFK